MKPLNINSHRRVQQSRHGKPLFTNPRRNIIQIKQQTRNGVSFDKENTQAREDMELTDMALDHGFTFNIDSKNISSNYNYNNRYDIAADIKNLLQNIPPDEVTDPGPLRNTYPYEYQLDTSGIIYQMISNPLSLSFPHELELKDLYQNLRWYHYPLYHLLNLDPLSYFELKTRRSIFYNNPWYHLQYEMNEDTDDDDDKIGNEEELF